MTKQLQMKWPEKAIVLPVPDLPAGYRLRLFRDGDESSYLDLMKAVELGSWSHEELGKWRFMTALPDGIFVVEHESTGVIAATAMACHRPTPACPNGGELGWVAARPGHTGMGLGKVVSLAVLHRLLSAGYRNIYLLTDDFRIPAIRTYLVMGFVPVISGREDELRWAKVHEEIRTGLTRKVRSSETEPMKKEYTADPCCPGTAGTITFLGTADGFPCADRRHAAILCRAPGMSLLLDCGESCSRSFLQAGIDFNVPDAIVISHTHSDHVAGLPMFIQSCWLAKRTRPLSVYLPEGAVKPLRQWIESCYLFQEDLKFQLNIESIEKAPCRVVPNTHLDRSRIDRSRSYPDVRFESFSLQMEFCGKRVGYSGDIGSPDDLAPLFPLDVLICELAHFDAQALACFLSTRSLERLLVTHVIGSARVQPDLIKEALPDAILCRDDDIFRLPDGEKGII